MKHSSSENTTSIRVSFDLDEVLFVSPDTHPTEPALPFPLGNIYRERLRLGTPHLIRSLQEMGVEVWIYTSSARTEGYLKGLFRHYGVRFDGIVNAQRHQAEVQSRSRERLPSKMPSHYRISLHIDDESIVCANGRAFGFDVYQLNAPDDQWEEKVMDRVRRIMEKEKREHGIN